MSNIQQELTRRILVLDGAAGTMIQRLGLTETDFRGDLFGSDHQQPLAGCNDVLCLTRPEAIINLHRQYLEAGADIIETNSFNANAVSLADYGLSDRVDEINRAAVRCAREAIRRYREEAATAEYANNDFADPSRPLFIAGSMGPSGVSLSIPDGHNTGDGHGVDFDFLEDTYFTQTRAMIEEGVDLLLLETIFDTLNAKAAIHGVRRAMRETGRDVPLMISATLTENGRLLSGQTLEAFCASIAHASAFSIGLNCGFGASEMLPHLRRLAKLSPVAVSAHPNAGLPDEMGQYSETPASMAPKISQMLNEGLLNIVGGCCGTTPDHIREIARLTRKAVPRSLPDGRWPLAVSGTEALDLDAVGAFVKVGERCNVAGSRKFLRLVSEGNLSEALDIAAAQVAKGARILDINMDDAMLDAPAEMEKFVRLLAMDRHTSPLPLMIDTSDMEVALRALKSVQGRSIVNSISLKNGEEDFLRRAREIRELGGTVVVMAFDEEGQATTLPRRTAILQRACRLLCDKAGYYLNEIVVDPNILAVATGIEEHDLYARDFLDTLKWIKTNLPGVKTSGGVSNLSFAFRGNDPVRKAMHALFLEKAIACGLDMAIVNPATPVSSEGFDPALLALIADLYDNASHDAARRLGDLAAEMKRKALAEKEAKAMAGVPVKPKKPTVELSPVERLANLVTEGRADALEEILAAALESLGSPMRVVKEALMAGMEEVGRMFAAGEMFLPQVVRSADVMKRAVEWLTPYIEAESAGSAAGEAAADSPLVVLATVKGDVHDIGKNIVAIVLKCSGFRVHDMGVMVPPEVIADTAIAEGASLIGLSGLITPSLTEMTATVAELERRGCRIPVFVGGATTSDLHTAVRIAPAYSGPVIRTPDAAAMALAASVVTDPERRSEYLANNTRSQQLLRDSYEFKKNHLSLAEARSRHAGVTASAPEPLNPGLHDLRIPVNTLWPLFNQRAFLAAWGLPPSSADSNPEALRLLREAEQLVLADKSEVHARILLARARREGDDIVVTSPDGTELRIPTLRCQTPLAPDGLCRAMADYVSADGDWLGFFAVTVAGSDLAGDGDSSADTTSYSSLLRQAVAHRIAEAATEAAHRLVRSDLWGLPENVGIRPAIGYSSMPDQSAVFLFDQLLNYGTMGITLTENGALSPSATTTGFIFGTPEAKYFEVGYVSDEQLADYGRRRNVTPESLHRFLRP